MKEPDGMKSLDKAFGILELVTNMGGQPVTPGVVAAELDLNGATCVRFMKYLSRRGYLEQVSRKDGYVVGPAGLTFADRQSRYSRLIDASEEPIRRLAHRLNNHINISVLYNSMRYLLYLYSCHTQKASGARRLEFTYDMATSRLLLSACSKEDRDEIIKRAGMPGKYWNDINDKPTLLKALQKTREAGCISFPEPTTGQMIVGGLILADGFPPAAIGFGIAGDEPTEALKHTADTVNTIEQNLSRKEIIF
jgi:DNA-binding IclR family transcriptional regulator